MQWKLNYREPAKEWIESLPLGNGEIGAMVSGGTRQETIELNLDTLWSGSQKQSEPYPDLPDWNHIRNWYLKADTMRRKSMQNPIF